MDCSEVNCRWVHFVKIDARKLARNLVQQVLPWTYLLVWGCLFWCERSINSQQHLYLVVSQQASMCGNWGGCCTLVCKPLSICLHQLSSSPHGSWLVHLQQFYHNIFYILVWYKNSIYFCVPCVWGILCRMQDICVHEQVWCLYLSMQDVTKHRDRSPSLMGINWVSDGVHINFSEYMHCKCYKTIMICHAYVTLTPAFHSTTFFLLSQPTSPMCPSWSRAISDLYMAIHIKHCQDLDRKSVV